MKVATVWVVTVMLSLILLVRPVSAQCSATGAGVIANTSAVGNFSGYAMTGKDGTAGGSWQHLDRGTGRLFDGQIVYIFCRHVDDPGPGAPPSPNGDFPLNQAYVGGPARVFFPESGWTTGFWLDVVIKDHGEATSTPDSYHITVRTFDGGSVVGPVLFETSGELVGGNIQLYPPNQGHPATPSLLPSWVVLEP